MENFRLKVFRAVSRHLNFSRAAEELMLTQPAVTQQIKALEDEYGVSLFDRSGGRIRLTVAGETLLPYAEQLRRLAEEAYTAVSTVGGTGAGMLHLGASQTIGQYLLPNIVSQFLRVHPRLQVSAKSGNTDAVLDMLVSRRIDLALIEGPALRKDVRVEPFMKDEMVLVVPAGHEWADQEVTLEALQTAPLLMREFGSGSRRVIEQALARAGVAFKSMQIPMELDSTEGLLSAVEAGLGVTFVSRWAVRNQLTLGTLRLAHVHALELSRMFSLVSVAGPEPSGIARSFSSFLMDLSPQPARKVPSVSIKS